MAAAPTHYLRANESEWSPGRVLVVDTETRSTRVDGLDTLALRLWVAARLDRRGNGAVGVQGAGRFRSRSA